MTSHHKAINWSILAACRFFLAFVVLNVHMEWFSPTPFSHFFSLFGGKAAVVGFLVISGYSITASLDRKPEKFMQRRFLRIYPAYLVTILMALALQLDLGQFQANGKDFSSDGLYTIACNLVLLQMYACKALSFTPAIWSLSIEFSFYVFIFILRDRFRPLLIALMAVSLAHFMLPQGAIDHPLYGLLMKLNMVRYFWPFALGVLMARGSSRPMDLGATALGAAFVFFSSNTPEPMSSLTYAIALLSIVAAKAGASRPSLALDYAGDLSYPLYLVHIPVAIALAVYADIYDATLISVVAISCSALVCWGVERPFARIMKRMGSNRIEHEAELAKQAAAS